ncbi:flagellar hook-associated protein FlgK [Sulfurimonas sp.]|uniref:flagellar hook-associated protein FlgK n=1 Tax=Sulfurimonas sp. TaxID=2022749 RepID=UPI0026231816|nr:flagellar hook-associated protein FlgK [Sulfurimonas sp.]MCW8896318.1 flagellar hook-associated protein FlgK [Sulfurimonas sp.]
MASLFNTLNIGYSGLVASQAGVSTTSHNIANAESDGYTRQRIVTSAATPVSTAPGQVGNGVDVTDITRIFDSFVFNRYTDISADKEYADYTESIMLELSTYFPEIDGVGIKADLQEYYNMWQTLADNPDNESIKLALAEQTENLAQNIKHTQDKIISLQSTINEKLKVNVDEVNAKAEELAEVNKAINLAEAADGYTANDLRDKRNQLELDLSKLIGAEVNTGILTSDITIDSSLNEATDGYSLNVNGFNIVDGSTFHPLHIDATGANGFYEISYERQDGSLLPMGEDITGGKIGAILDLRGSNIDDTTSGIPTDGTLQNVVSQMDAFAAGLIESTNNLYAANSATSMQSNTVSLNPNNSLVSSDLNIKEGAFDIAIYDIDGNETARRTININASTVMSGAAGTNSIEGQILTQNDDNSDSNANNDIDDFITSFNWALYANGEGALELEMDSLSASKGYTFSIEDNLSTNNFDSGSNFAGALGLNRFFDGDSASNINLSSNLRNNTSNISAGITPTTGDNQLALSMVQQQFEKYDFEVGNTTSYNTTMYGMFDIVATGVGVETNRAILSNESITAQFNATENEYASISKVSVDEELTNLIKYQTAYGAASKIITTIDQMMQTLLGIKQ